MLTLWFARTTEFHVAQ